MEHLFHPWHWLPLLAALPLAGTFTFYARQKWQEFRCRRSTSK